MTGAPNTLNELKLLREAPLPAGFEDRLRERLIVVASEKKVLRIGARKRRARFLLLAAIVVPVAALAASGVFVAQRFTEPASSATSTVLAKRPVQTKPKVSSFPVTTQAAVSSEPTSEIVTEKEPNATLRKHGSAAKDNTSSRVNTLTTKVKSVRSEPVKTVPAKTEAKKIESVPAKVERVPARIESLELNIPKKSNSTNTGASAGQVVKSSELRNLPEQGVPARVGEAQETSRQNREQAGERRGRNGAQQSKERVRERKGQ